VSNSSAADRSPVTHASRAVVMARICTKDGLIVVHESKIETRLWIGVLWYRPL